MFVKKESRDWSCSDSIIVIPKQSIIEFQTTVMLVTSEACHQHKVFQTSVTNIDVVRILIFYLIWHEYHGKFPKTEIQNGLIMKFHRENIIVG